MLSLRLELPADAARTATRAKCQGVRFGCVLGDAEYGKAAIFRHGLSARGLLWALGLAGALLGFIVWNKPPARIYLGDAGAYLLGTWLALLAEFPQMALSVTRRERSSC